MTVMHLASVTHHGYTICRQNITGIYDAAKARWRVNPQSRRGVPDICSTPQNLDSQSGLA